MNPGSRASSLPDWLREGRYDTAASDKEKGVYLYHAGWWDWEWFVHTPNRSYRGWHGWAPRITQAYHNAYILASNPGGVSWINDATGFPG